MTRAVGAHNRMAPAFRGSGAGEIPALRQDCRGLWAVRELPAMVQVIAVAVAGFMAGSFAFSRLAGAGMESNRSTCRELSMIGLGCRLQMDNQTGRPESAARLIGDRRVEPVHLRRAAFLMSAGTSGGRDDR